jgi:hypothetical protein
VICVSGAAGAVDPDAGQRGQCGEIYLSGPRRVLLAPAEPAQEVVAMLRIAQVPS